jgi:hypothetical protein
MLPDPTKCPYCGMFHDTTCQRIKAIEYYPDGSQKRVEFHPPEPISAAPFSIQPNTSGR